MLVHSNAEANGLISRGKCHWQMKTMTLVCSISRTHTHIHKKMKTSMHAHTCRRKHAYPFVYCTSTAQTSTLTITLDSAAMEHSTLPSWNHRTHIVTTFSNYTSCVLSAFISFMRWCIRAVENEGQKSNWNASNMYACYSPSAKWSSSSLSLSI